MKRQETKYKKVPFRLKMKARPWCWGGTEARAALTAGRFGSFDSGWLWASTAKKARETALYAVTAALAQSLKGELTWIGAPRNQITLVDRMLEEWEAFHLASFHVRNSPDIDRLYEAVGVLRKALRK